MLKPVHFLVSKRSCIGPSSRIGDNVTVFEVPADEAVDIDTMQDWIVCEAMLSRRLIVFRVDGHKELGLGHVYRALTLGYELIEHDVVFVCNARHREGIAKLKSANMPVFRGGGRRRDAPMAGGAPSRRIRIRLP